VRVLSRHPLSASLVLKLMQQPEGSCVSRSSLSRKTISGQRMPVDSKKASMDDDELIGPREQRMVQLPMSMPPSSATQHNGQHSSEQLQPRSTAG
jgi:hypothetical protein